MSSEGGFEAQRRALLREFADTRAVARLWAKDHTLWQAGAQECADRLGWLHEPAAAIADSSTLTQWRHELRAAGVEGVVWCGMGGSSLFPELVARAPLPRADGFPLQILDTSHPAAIARSLRDHDPGRTLYVFASKSGGTIETRAQLDTLAAHAHAGGGRFAVVTDPGGALDELARGRNWRVWHSNPEIGGRFSAISRFGTVATALSGVDSAAIAEPALALARACTRDQDNPALELAAFLGAAHRLGRDKLTLVTPPILHGFGAWVEQLVAESTGKHGVGILPVVDEPLGAPDDYGDDRCFVTYGEVAGIAAIRAAGHPVLDLGPVAAGALGAELMRWMLATAWVGAALHINPFDQPDVESAKRGALAVLDAGVPAAEQPAAPPDGDAAALLRTLTPGDHIVIQAFIDPASYTVVALEAARVRLRTAHRCAVSIGIGPRYLHSTGQLHKGGPNSGVFLQILDPGTDDVAIPGRSFGFAALLRAQADGDYAALVHAGRRVVRVDAAAVLALT